MSSILNKLTQPSTRIETSDGLDAHSATEKKTFNVAAGIVLSLLPCIYLCLLFACFLTACFWRNEDAYVTDWCTWTYNGRMEGRFYAAELCTYMNERATCEVSAISIRRLINRLLTARWKLGSRPGAMVARRCLTRNHYSVVHVSHKQTVELVTGAASSVCLYGD